MVDDTLTARNRINQRNFRARRQNYIKDLEERLRKYESDGVQATIEIQAAARQVTDQNTKLRALLMSRLGMNDQEIESYLNTHGPPLSMQSNLLPVSLTSGILPKSADLLGLNSTTSFQSIAPSCQQSTASSILSPALGLASLHRAAEQFVSSEPPSKKQCRELSDQMSLSALAAGSDSSLPELPAHSVHSGTFSSVSSNQDRLINDQDPDTLSESSNPQTPSEQHDSILQPYPKFCSNNSVVTEMKIPPLSSITRPGSNTGRVDPYDSRNVNSVLRSQSPTTQADTGCGAAHESQVLPTSQKPKAGDETTCEDAARIIASMRGTNERPEQILLELGCISSSQGGTAESCKVKNLSIFSLMDGRA